MSVEKQSAVTAETFGSASYFLLALYCVALSVWPLVVLAIMLLFTDAVVYCLLCAGLVFEGIGFFDVGIAVFLAKYGTLAKHLLICDSAELTDSQVAQYLQNLLKPVAPQTI